MYEMKKYFKSKEFLLSMAVILGFTLVNIYSFLKINAFEGIKLTYKSNPDLNVYTFWNYARHREFAEFIILLSPLIITYAGLSCFSEKVKGNYLKDAIMRSSYKKVMLKEIGLAYFKGSIVFILLSLIIFIIGGIFFSWQLLPGSDFPGAFVNEAYSSPLLHVFLVTLLIIPYSIFIVNLGFITLKVIKKMNLTVILNFVFFFGIYMVTATVIETIANNITNEALIKYLYEINIYEAYYIYSNVFRAFLNTSVYVVFSSIALYFTYKDKEQVVNWFE